MNIDPRACACHSKSRAQVEKNTTNLWDFDSLLKRLANVNLLLLFALFVVLLGPRSQVIVCLFLF